jgi:uncharacterized protein YkwD
MSHALAQTARRSRVATGLLLAATVAGGALAAPAAAAPAAASEAQLRWGVVHAVNEIRAEQGCKPVKVARKLNKSAQRHADDMSAKEYFSHTSADGRSWVSRQRAAGWKKPGGENIARGFDAVGSVMTAWMNSPGHRRNIVNCNFRHIGVGFTADGEYWVQNFGY